MKIRIRKDALNFYIEDHTDYIGNYFGDDRWEQIMSSIAGKTLDVDTEMLFKHEFNTMPIPNVSEEGLRIFEEYVDKIIDDERHGKALCDLCQKVSNSTEKCEHCGRSEYLEIFLEE